MSFEQDACREFARNVGRDNPNNAWILTFFDSWEPNPFYSGPPVPHPEADEDEASGAAVPVVWNDIDF